MQHHSSNSSFEWTVSMILLLHTPSPMPNILCSRWIRRLEQYWYDSSPSSTGILPWYPSCHLGSIHHKSSRNPWWQLLTFRTILDRLFHRHLKQLCCQLVLSPFSAWKYLFTLSVFYPKSALPMLLQYLIRIVHYALCVIKILLNWCRQSPFFFYLCASQIKEDALFFDLSALKQRTW